jgi:serine O-acetyltransferase
MLDNLKYDIKIIKERDPAARSSAEVFFLYPGLWAVIFHRLAHFLHIHKWYFPARLISQCVRFATGIEIHPGAKIGKGLFIDHGMGVVIGETAEIGDNVTIYQGVTLGGTGKEKGKRHPTIGDNVLIGAGAKVLGPFTVGENSKIAANSVVLTEIPENCTCVGAPARVVKRNNEKVSNLDHIHMPDPVSQELCKMMIKIEALEKQVTNKARALGNGDNDEAL